MAAPERWWIVAHPERPTAATVISSAGRPGGPEWIVVAGPFPTKAAAQASLTQRDKPPTIPLPNPFKPLTDLGKVGHWIGDVVLHLTDGAMWRSLGWLLLGAFLVIAGIYLWFRTSGTYKDLESAALGAVKAL